MKLLYVARNGTKTDITQLYESISWTGDYTQAARVLTCSLVNSPLDKMMPQVVIELGEMLILQDSSAKEIFRGYVFRKEKSLSGNSIELTAYDGLIYLTKSKINRIFKGTTAAAVARTVCTEIGVPVGYLQDDGDAQRFTALSRTAYEAIMIAYTGVSKVSGHKYIPRMSGGRLSVIRKGTKVSGTVLRADSNLTDATYTESIEDMINIVRIVDKNDNYVGEVSNASDLRNYGRLQDIYQQEEHKDAYAIAKAQLKGIERTASVIALGSGQVDLITGNAVRIRDEHTGLVGLFYIDSDEHTFEGGIHTINLTVNFQNIMDEQEGGDIESGSNQATSSGTFSLDNFVYP